MRSYCLTALVLLVMVGGSFYFLFQTGTAGEKRSSASPVSYRASTPAQNDPHRPTLPSLAFVGPVLPQPERIIRQPRETPKVWSVPAHAVQAVQLDAKTVPVADLPFTRWFWVQSGEAEDFKALSDSLQRISRSPNIRKPIIKGIIARIDLRWYAPRIKDTQEWIENWELLQFDPWFSLLITKDTINALTNEQKNTLQVATRQIIWKKDTNNQWFDTGKKRTKFVPLKDTKDIVVVRVNAPHLAQTGLEKLQIATGSIAPIVDSRYFMRRALATIKDKDGNKDSVYSTIWGGLYYEFTGIRKAVDKGTDLDQLLEDLGVGNIKRGITFEKLFENARSDERAAIFHSNVTGKPRRIVWFATLASRLTRSPGVVFITEDQKDKSVDVSQHPILNLVKFHVDAYEVIFTKSNGHLGYAIYDEKQKLLDEAAIEVVADHDVPVPNSPRLQSGKSCISCHGKSEGWIPFDNDAQKMLNRRKLDVFGDITKQDEAIADTIDRIVGWYSGNPTELLMTLRNAQAKAIIFSTGNWKNAVPDQSDVARVSAAKIMEIWNDDSYGQVGAATAIRELGFNPVEKGKETDFLETILPPEKTARFGDIFIEDPRIFALKTGIKINRKDWQFVYSFALNRANKQRMKLDGKK